MTLFHVLVGVSSIDGQKPILTQSYEIFHFPLTHTYSHKYLHAYVSTGRPVQNGQVFSDLEEGGGTEEEERGDIPKLLVMDLRSYTAALANRAKGGGFECNGKRTSSGWYNRIMCTFGDMVLS